MSPRVAATGTVRGGTVMTSFGPCKRHAQNGLTAAADHPDGLCADCRSTVTASVMRQNTYNGTQPLQRTRPPRSPTPRAARGADSTARKAERLDKFKAKLTELSAGPDLAESARPPSSRLIREAGTAVGVGDTAARSISGNSADLRAQAMTAPTQDREDGHPCRPFPPPGPARSARSPGTLQPGAGQ